MTENVLEKLGTTETTTLNVRREEGGKIRVASLLWEAPKVILRGEVLEVRNVDGVLQIARKRRYHDDQCLSAVNVNIELFCAAARGVPQRTSWKKFWSGIDADLAAKLRALAERVRRNVPLRNDPETLSRGEGLHRPGPRTPCSKA
jgi:hypothetical protein